MSSLPLITDPIAVALNDCARDHLHEDHCTQAFGGNTLSKPHSGRLITILRRIWGLQIMTSVSAKMEDQQKSWLGKVLGCDGDRHFPAMEHEAGIEQVTGHRLVSGREYGSGCEFGFGY